MAGTAHASARERCPEPECEYGPSGPCEQSVQAYGENRHRNLDNTSITGGAPHAVAGNGHGKLNDPNI